MSISNSPQLTHHPITFPTPSVRSPPPPKSVSLVEPACPGHGHKRSPPITDHTDHTGGSAAVNLLSVYVQPLQGSIPAEAGVLLTLRRFRCPCQPRPSRPRPRQPPARGTLSPTPATSFFFLSFPEHLTQARLIGQSRRVVVFVVVEPLTMYGQLRHNWLVQVLASLTCPTREYSPGCWETGFSFCSVSLYCAGDQFLVPPP